MRSLQKDPFRGCMTDNDAITLGILLTNGAMYYYENESRLKKKGITESDWAERIRQSTNNIIGNATIESFKELENYKIKEN